MAKTVLVTGGSGFVGGHLLPYLSKNLGGEVTNLDLKPSPHNPTILGDIACPPTNVPTPEVIVHMAAVSREPGFPPPEYYRVNVEGTARLLDWATLRGVKRVINFSSISVFGASEKALEETSPHRPETPYGMSKSRSEDLVRAWVEGDPSRSAVSLRPGIVFGPGDPGNFGRLLKAVRRGWFVLPGRTDTKKAGIYVKDLVRLVAFLTNAPSLPTSINAVYPGTPPLLSLVENIQGAVAPDRRRPPIVLPEPLIRATVATLGLTEARKPVFERTFHSRRVDKLVSSTNVGSIELGKLDFEFEWDWSTSVDDWVTA